MARTDAKGRILKGLGFRLSEESIQTDVSRLTRRFERQDRERRQEAIDDLIANQGNPEKLKEISQQIQREGLVFTRKQLQTEAAKKQMTRVERAFLNASPETKAILAPIFEFADIGK